MSRPHEQTGPMSEATGRAAAKTRSRSHGQTVTRNAARRALAHLRAPDRTLIDDPSSCRQACFMVQVLARAAAPLPAALQARMAPWRQEMDAQAEAVLAEARRAARPRVAGASLAHQGALEDE